VAPSEVQTEPGNIDRDTLAERVARYPWFHSIDLGHGVVTPGGVPLAMHHIQRAVFFDRVDLVGKSVIDIGAWNGIYSFEAKRRGAARVLATDHFVWKHPTLRPRDI
jgi:tRNA (mo5U34)-methyltransferase